MADTSFARTPLQTAMDQARARREIRAQGIASQPLSTPKPTPVPAQAEAPGSAAASTPPSDMNPFEAASLRHNVPINILQAVAEAAGAPDRAEDFASKLAGPLSSGSSVPDAIATMFDGGKIPDGFLDVVRSRATEIGKAYSPTPEPETDTDTNEKTDDRSILEKVIDPFGTTKELGKGLIRGVAGAVGAGAKTLGYDETATDAGNIASDPRIAPDVQRFGDVSGPASAAKYVTGLGAESGPEMLAVMAAAAAGSIAGPVGTVGGAIGASAFFNTGRNLLRQEQENPQDQTSYAKAVATGLAQGGLDAVVPGHILGAFGTRFLGAFAEHSIVKVGKELGSDAAMEAVTEGAQQLMEIAQANPDLLRVMVDPKDSEVEKSDQLMSEMIESMVAGGAVGGAFSAGGMIARSGSPAPFEGDDQPPAPLALPAPALITPPPPQDDAAAAAPVEPDAPLGPMERALSKGPAPIAPALETGAEIDIQHTDPETGEIVNIPAIFVSEEPTGVRVRDSEGNDHIVPREEIEAGVSVLSAKGAAAPQADPVAEVAQENETLSPEAAISDAAAAEGVPAPVDQVAPATIQPGGLDDAAQANIARRPFGDAAADAAMEPQTPDAINERLEYLRSARRTGTNLKRINAEIKSLNDRLASMEPTTAPEPAPLNSPKARHAAKAAALAAPDAPLGTPTGAVEAEAPAAPAQNPAQASAPEPIAEAAPVASALSDPAVVGEPAEDEVTADPDLAARWGRTDKAAMRHHAWAKSVEAALPEGWRMEYGPKEKVYDGILSARFIAPNGRVSENNETATTTYSGMKPSEVAADLVARSEAEDNFAPLPPKPSSPKARHEAKVAVASSPAHAEQIQAVLGSRKIPEIDGKNAENFPETVTISKDATNPVEKLEAEVSAAAAEANPDPTDGQKSAGNYRMGHTSIHGLDVTIENAKGATRSGKDPDGNAWSVEMPAHYGYFKRTEGADGDHVDVYVGEHPESDRAFIIDQFDGDTLDEHKTVLGAETAAEALAIYDAGFSDGKGPDRRRNAQPVEMSVDEFKVWLKDGDHTKPVGAPAEDLDAMFNDLLDELAPEAKTEPAPVKEPAPSAAPATGLTYLNDDFGNYSLPDGSRLVSAKGRALAPSPKFDGTTPRKRKASLTRQREWLIAEAQAEAKAQNDEFVGRMFDALEAGNFPRASFDSVNDYLFGDPDGPQASSFLPADPDPAPKPPRGPRTAKAAATSAAVNTGMGIADIAKGLTALFGDPNKLSSGITFDKETYENAKPFFIAGAKKFSKAGADIRDTMRALMKALMGEGMDRSALQRMQPYVVEFAKDVQSGAIDLAEGDDADGNGQAGGLGDEGKSADGVGAGLGSGKPDGDRGDSKLEGTAPGSVPSDDGASGAAATGARPGRKDRPAAGDIPEGGDALVGRPDASVSGLDDDGSRNDKPAPPARSNYRITDPEALFGGGPKGRFAKNRAAIEAFQAVTDEGREPTPDELDAMASYIGWGSFGQELFQGTWDRPQERDGWKDENQWLRDTLGKEAWSEARDSIINAHYTDPPTVHAMWSMVEKLGFKGGRVLEPSVGVGNFFGLMPAHIEQNSDLTGIELDRTTGGMAKLLYPRANIRIQGYEENKAPDNFYDLVIGNWPFANVEIADRRYQKLRPSLHNYFFLKALDQVRPGGLVVGITSAFTMDGASYRGLRTHLARNAELVGSWRLPTGAFGKYAGTAVVTDIIVLKKREAPILDVSAEGWIDITPVKTPSGHSVNVNEFFAKAPLRVLGTLNFGSRSTYGSQSMIVDRGEDFPERLAAIMNDVPADTYAPITRGAEPRFISNNSSARQLGFTEKDGELWQVKGDRMVALDQVAKYKTSDAAVTASRVAEIKGLIDIRRKTGAVLDADRDGLKDADKKRAALKKAYQAFKKAHGPISDSFAIKLFQKAREPFYGMLRALENYDGTPAAIMSKATTRAARSIESPTVRDAFVLQRNETMVVDLADIAKRAGTTAEKATAELLASGAIYRAPGGAYEASEQYLAGNVRVKLREARSALEQGEDMEASVKALEAVQPPDVPYFNIEARLGADWIDPDHTRQFIGDILGVAIGRPDDVVLTRGITGWNVAVNLRLQNRVEAAHFTGGNISFAQFVQKAMNSETIDIRVKTEDGVIKDPKLTEIANERAGEFREKFSSWIWKDPERRMALEREYNEAMNSVASPVYDGSFLDFPGMTLQRGDSPFNLRKHQADAIWRGVVNQRGLFAHEVGTGKTVTMTAIAVESRRYGLARKPLIIAHNANSAAVAAEAQDTYPGGKFLYVDNLSPAEIQTTLNRIAMEDWDAVVIPHSLLDRLGLKEETLKAMAADDIAQYEREAIEAADAEGVHLTPDMMDGNEKDLFDTTLNSRKGAGIRTAKEMVKARNRIIQTIKKQALAASKEGFVAFEDLGIDMILVDEVQEFKKPPIATRMSVKGLNKATSNKSMSLRFLTNYVKAQRNGKGIFTFTGTMITNTLTEAFHQMSYVMDDVMRQNHVDRWDGFFKTFADSISDVEVTAAGDYESVERLAAFINVAELRRMASQYIDTVFADDMPEFKPRQTKSGKTLKSEDLTSDEAEELRDGWTDDPKGRPYKKTINDIGPMSAAQRRIFEEVIGYAREFREAKGKERMEIMRAGGPNAPIVFNAVPNRASMDARLHDMSIPEEAESKANRAVRNIASIYHGDDLATQMLFVDQGYSDEVTRTKTDSEGNTTRTKVKKFNLVGDMVDKMVAAGIPRAEIAVVAGGVTAAKKRELAEKMNRREIRVLIGQSGTIGVGVNAQKWLRAMHHLDAPWMPGDLEQRNGRGQRQGNHWNTVLEYRYLTEGLDGRRWQVLAIKDRFIKAFMKADMTVRTIEGDAVDDADSMDAMGLADTLAQASGDPRILIVNKLKKKVERLKRKERLHTEGIADAKHRIKFMKKRNAEASERNITMAEDAAFIDGLKESGAPYKATISGKDYEKRADASAALQKVTDGLGALPRGDWTELPVDINGFKLWALPHSWQKGSVSFQIRRAGEYDLGTGSMASIDASIRGISSRIARSQESIADSERSIANLERASGEDFPQTADLSRAKRDLAALEADMQTNPIPPPSWLRQGAPVDTVVTFKGDERVVTGHRWDKDGWFVLTEEGDVPYLEAKDDAGMAIYDEKPFTAPKIEEGAKLSTGEKPSVAAEAVSAPFASAASLRRSLSQGALAAPISKMLESGKLVIHDDSSSLPGWHQGVVQGVTDGDGVIHLVASNLNAKTALAVLLHEMFHAGVEPLVGSRVWNGIMSRMNAALIAAEARRENGERSPTDAFWDAALARVAAADTPSDRRAEELAAYAIEERENAPAGLRIAVENLIGEIKAFILRRFGKQMGAITIAQLRALTMAALRSQPVGGGPAGPGGNRFSASGDGGPEGADFAADFIAQLTAVDSLFQNPTSRAGSIKGVFADIDPSVTFIGETQRPEDADEGRERFLLRTAPTAREPKGHDFYVYQSDETVWIDVSQLGEGMAGSAIYQAVSDYAFNTGRTFIGDPDGLSDIALRRRTEAMISSAFKHGTTDHIEPHERQVKGDEALGVPPLKWRSGDTLGNIAAMIDVSIANLLHHIPELARARYDFTTRTFRTSSGEPISDEMLDRWRLSHSRIGKARAGRTTLKRGILLNTLAHAQSGERPGLLALALRQSNQLVTDGGLNRTFYSMAANAPARAIPDAEFDAAERGLIGNALTKAMSGSNGYNLLALVPGRPLFSELGKDMPTAQQYFQQKGEMDALRGEWHSRTDKIAQKWRKLIGQHGPANKTFMDIIHESTLAALDPTKAFVRDPKRNDNSQRRRQHAALSDRFLSLPKDFQGLYSEVRDIYRDLGDEFEKTLLNNVDKAMDVGLARAQRAYDATMEEAQDDGLSGAALASVRAAADKKLATAKVWAGWNKKSRLADLRAKFETNKVAAPYFPLARFGAFTVTVREHADGPVISFSKFESPGPGPITLAKRKMGLDTAPTQQEFAAEMRAAGYHVETGTMGETKTSAMVDANFVADIEGILQNAGVPDAVMESVWQRWLETLPDFSIRKARIHRKGTPGFDSDALRAFGHHMFHGSHQLARLRFAMDMQETLDLTKASVRHQADPVRAGLIVDEMERRHEFTMNPKGAWWSQAISSAAFFFHLALTPAAALVNLTQTTIIGPAILGGFLDQGAAGHGVAVAALGKALVDFTKGKGHAMDSDTLNADEKSALTEAYRRGTIDSTQAHDLAGVAESGVEYSDRRTKIMGIMSFAFHHTERLNREVTFLAAYRLALGKGLSHLDAIDKAAALTWDIHFDYQNTSRPRAMQGDGAKTLLIFKNYSANMLWRLVRDTHQAVAGGTPEDRREAIHHLGGITASMALHAGVKGTWLYGLTMMLVGMFFGGGSDDAEEELTKGAISLLGPFGASMVLDGIPGAITGTSLSERIGMPDLWFRSPDRPLEGKDEYLYWVEQFLGAGVGLIGNQFVGANLIADGNVERGIETMAPRFMRDAMRAARYAFEGVTTMKGDPILENVDPQTVLKQLLGFTPAAVAERYDINSKMKNRENRIQYERSDITAEFVAALRDSGHISDRLIARRDAYNQENPDYPITGKSVRASLVGKIRASERNEFGASLNPRLNDRIRAEAAPQRYGE